MEQKKFISYNNLSTYNSAMKSELSQKIAEAKDALIGSVTDEPSANTLNAVKTYAKELIEEQAAPEIFIGDGDMPEAATIQLIMDGEDEEQALKDELKEYIDTEIKIAQEDWAIDEANSGAFKDFLEEQIRDRALYREDILQTTGDATTQVMSQKAVSDFVGDRAESFVPIELLIESAYFDINGTFVDDVSRVHAIHYVQAGEKYLLSTKVQKWGLAGFIFMDNSNNVISAGFDGQGTVIDIVDHELICPESACKLIVQSTNSYFLPRLTQVVSTYTPKWYTKAETDEKLAELSGGVKTVNGLSPDEDGNIELSASEECITPDDLTLAFESVGLVSLARDEDNVVYTDKNGKPYAIRQSNLSNIVKTINNENPDKQGNINVSEFTTEKFAEELEAFGEISLVRYDDETFFTDKDGNILLFDYPSSATSFESGYFLGKTEDGEIIRIPQKTVGTVRTINGLAPDEVGDIEVCKALVNVGKHIDVEGEVYSIQITKNTALGGRSFEITEEGATFRIWFNGKTYDCISRKKVEDGYTCYVVGNDNVSNDGGPDTGEPFYYSFKKSNDNTKSDYGIIRVREHGNHTFAIAKVTNEIITVPQELLPKNTECEALADVGKYIEVEGKPFEATFTKNTAFRGDYFEITGEGQLYKVLFNGELYMCKSRKNIANGYIAYIIGNDDISNDGGTNTGEPFYYCFKKYTDGYNSDYALIRVRERGNYSISITEVSKELIKIPEELLPKVDVGVKTVNNETPDENGNVDIKIPECKGIKTINNELPDENGNIDIISSPIKTVNNRYPDMDHNISISPALMDVGYAFIPTQPIYAYYAETKTDNGAVMPYLSSSIEHERDIIRIEVKNYDGDDDNLLKNLGYRQFQYSDVKDIDVYTSVNTYYKGVGNLSILNNSTEVQVKQPYEDTGEAFVCYSYITYGTGDYDAGGKVVFKNGKEYTYCVKVGQNESRDIPLELIPDLPFEKIRNRYVGVKTINGQYPDHRENIDICKELMNVGNHFVLTQPLYSYYSKYGCTNGAHLPSLDIDENEVIRITIDYTTYEFHYTDKQEFYTENGEYYKGFGNFSKLEYLNLYDVDGNKPTNTGEPFVFYDTNDNVEELGDWETSFDISGTPNYSIARGRYENNKIPQELLPETKPSVIVIDCPDFSKAEYNDDGSIQTYLTCETLGGYTLSEMQEFIKNGGTVRLKRDSSAWGYLYENLFYDVIAIGKVRNSDNASTIIFSATFPVVDVYIDSEDGVLYCDQSFSSTTATYPIKISTIVWDGQILINDYKSKPTYDDEEEEL